MFWENQYGNARRAYEHYTRRGDDAGARDAALDAVLMADQAARTSEDPDEQARWRAVAAHWRAVRAASRSEG